MDVLRVEVAVLEDEIAGDVLHAGALEIRRPLLHHRRGRAVVETPADGRIAAADDFHVSVQRAAGVDLTPRVDAGRDLERRLEQVDGRRRW